MVPGIKIKYIFAHCICTYICFPIKAITIGEGWIAIATDSRMVRIITVGGIQKQIFSIAGPVVCMAAHSNQLLVVYHKGTGKSRCLMISSTISFSVVVT